VCNIVCTCLNVPEMMFCHRFTLHLCWTLSIEVYLICMTFQELAVLPSAGDW
jgi:hypothetical protein